ncbi:ImpA family type VI secretion system protein [Poseidonocella sp. HB161398]|uniref:type VI secretion system protein TssA n=1 Tax=Poseidonocella sp. HB161398 TaxID=2320855 RepID=UPI001486F1BA|nr:type VI secretion system ImpA family N-terminal domain-containing protein [Poseidonocella sp. HB161398]
MRDDASVIQVEPIAGGAPCGEALDYDLEFLDLEILARGQPARRTGDSVAPGEGPDWGAVWELGSRLALRAHDLRLELMLARAALAREGAAALALRLERVAALAAAHWPGLHPCPEEEDEDETVRLNALAEFADPGGLLGDLRGLVLVSSRRAGSFCYRDWHAARYEDSPEHDTGQIAAALAEAPAAEHDALWAGLAACSAAVAAIDAAVRAQVPPQDMPQLLPLETLLAGMAELLEPYLSAPPEAAPAEAPARAGRGAPGSREEVVEMLDRICRWYRLNEPASPVPALLERARQMVSKDFLALLQDLAPAGADEFRHLAGLRPPAADGAEG